MNYDGDSEKFSEEIQKDEVISICKVFEKYDVRKFIQHNDKKIMSLIESEDRKEEVKLIKLKGGESEEFKSQ